MLAYQPVCYFGLKKVGVRDLEEWYNGLSANISHQVVLYYDIKYYQGITNEKQVTIPVN